jgi:aminoglycoside 3-N-acetyltransferase
MLVARSRLARDLRKLGLGPGGVTMVHCRMSALGYVVGGAETVVRALLDAVGPGGTLMAYTGWQDEPPDDLDSLDEETRRIYIEEHPAYDPRVALSRRDHGRVPEALRTWPGARHSGHPEAGVAAVGPLADVLTAEHPYDDAYGAGTPYARLVELGGRVALLGAPLDTVTLVHHAEAVAEVPDKRSVSCGMPVIVGGERLWRTFSDIDTAQGALRARPGRGGPRRARHPFGSGGRSWEERASSWRPRPPFRRAGPGRARGRPDRAELRLRGPRRAINKQRVGSTRCSGFRYASGILC